MNGKSTFSIDTSVIPLHTRGYRVDITEAPIKETLAALIIRMAGLHHYNLEQQHEKLVVYDPMCGSGTLLAEAAMALSQTPAGWARSKWGFFHLPNFDMHEWLHFKQQADANRKPLHPSKIILIGTDIDNKAVQCALSNFKRLDWQVSQTFDSSIIIKNMDFKQFEPPTKDLAPSVIITNAPFGVRLGDEQQLPLLYRSLGDWIKKQSAKPTAKGWILTGDMALSKQVGLKPRQRHIMSNGGIDSRLLEFDLY